MDNEFKDWSKNDLVREVIKLRELLSDQLEAAPGVGPSVEVQGIVSVDNGFPIVQMRAGEAVWQMTPAQARQHSFLIINAAVEAERDAASVAFLENELDFNDNQATHFLALMRNHRKGWFEDFKNLGSETD